ncbi:MAG: hypothetical protein BWY78_00571 [Alphaproteobacteria bacterium ADurb.Bin438]|nr:MAG: hypothetical protein BWY78_00571 [Alphaproteobacteria bacterium ADurb.Bin438]
MLGDINHFTKDSKRSRYIGTLPETFNNPDFSSMKDLKSYLTKKYKDEKGKAFYDLIVKKGNSVYNKFPAKSPNYVAKYLKEPFDNMPINGNINNVLGDSPTSLNNNIIPQEKYIINNNGKVSRASTPQVSTKDNLVGITGNTPSQLDQNNIIISHNFDKVKKLEEVLSLKRIQEEISKVVNDSEFELRLGKKPNQRSFGVLNEVKKNLDDTIKNRFSQTEIEGGKRIEEYKNMLIDAMDEVLDGKNGRPDYKAARQHSGDKIRIENILGVHSGKSEAMNTVFNSSMFPKQFVSHYRDLKIPEREAFRVAVRNDMLGQLGRYKTDTTAINQFLTSNTKDKLRLALSKGKTNRLTDFFEQERRATNNINKILGGSQTYEKQALSDAFLSGDLKGASFNFLKKLFKGRMSDKRAELAAKVFSKPTDKNLIKDLKRMRILKLRGKEEALLPGFIGGKFGDETSSN